MPLAPEQQARERIDELLKAAGWAIQDMAGFNRNAAEGVAVREFVLPSGPCDYLLFVAGKAAGVIEATDIARFRASIGHHRISAVAGTLTCTRH